MTCAQLLEDSAASLEQYLHFQSSLHMLGFQRVITIQELPPKKRYWLGRSNELPPKKRYCLGRSNEIACDLDAQNVHYQDNMINGEENVSICSNKKNVKTDDSSISFMKTLTTFQPVEALFDVNPAEQVISKDTLYKQYVTWCRQNNKSPACKSLFYRNITGQFVKSHSRPRINGKRIPCVQLQL